MVAEGCEINLEGNMCGGMWISSVSLLSWGGEVEWRVYLDPGGVLAL